jgi:Spy/CpxP family protein refolding chaperone
MTRTRGTITKTLLVALLVTGTAVGALADPGDDDGLGFRRRPQFMRHLFSPRLIMQNQEAIGLTDAQQKQITKAVADVQSELTGVTWELEKASEQLGTLLEGDQADVQAVVRKADEVMALEQRMKRAHLAMLVEVKNQLTAEQQKQLRALKGPERDRRRRFLPKHE